MNGVVSLPQASSRLEAALAGEDQVENRYRFEKEDPHPSKILATRSKPDHRLGELYDFMLERDLDLDGYCGKMADAMVALPRTIEPADSSPKALEAAKLVHHALAQVKDLRIAYEHLDKAFTHGVAFVENDWTQLTSGDFQGAWVPSRMTDRPMRRFLFRKGELYVRRPDGQHIVAPPGKFLVVRSGTADSPWGKGVLDAIYWFHFVKMELIKAMAIHLDRFASPLPYVEYPWKSGDSDHIQTANEQMVAEALRVLRALKVENAAAVPQGLELKILEASQSGNANYAEPIRMLNRAMAVRITGEVNTLGLRPGTGSYASDQVSDGIRMELVKKHCSSIASGMRDGLFAAIVALNLGLDYPVPRLHFHLVEAEDLEQRRAGVESTLAAGEPVPRRYFYRTMLVPEPKEGEEVILRETSTAPPPVPGPALSQPGTALPSQISLANRAPKSPRKLAPELADGETISKFLADETLGYYARQQELAVQAFAEGRLVPGGDGLSWLVDAMQPRQLGDLLHAATVHGTGLGARQLIASGVGEPLWRFSNPQNPVDLPISPARAQFALGDGWRQSGANPATQYWSQLLNIAKTLFLDLDDTARRFAFTVAGIEDVAMLSEIRALAETAHGESWGLPQWRASLEQVYTARGLTATSRWHADLIQWNTTRSANAGVLYEQLINNPAARRVIPYLRWDTRGDGKVRERKLHNHEVMDGKVFSLGHAIWQMWWILAGHNDRCNILTVNRREAQRLGYVGDEPTGPWPIDPNTGQPALPDPGFRGAPRLVDQVRRLETALTHRVANVREQRDEGLLAAIGLLLDNLLKTLRRIVGLQEGYA